MRVVTVNSKAVLGFGLVLFSLLFVAVTAYQVMDKARDKFTKIQTLSTPLQLSAGALKSEILTINRAISTYVSQPQLSRRKQLIEQWQTNLNDAKANVIQIKQLNRTLDLNADLPHLDKLQHTLMKIRRLNDSLMQRRTVIAEEQALFEEYYQELKTNVEELLTEAEGELQTVRQLYAIKESAEALFSQISVLRLTPNQQQLDHVFQLKELFITTVVSSFDLLFNEAVLDSFALEEFKTLVENFQQQLIRENAYLVLASQQIKQQINQTELLSSLNQNVDKDLTKIDVLIVKANSINQHINQRLNQSISNSFTTLVVVGLMAILVAVAMGYWISSSIRTGSRRLMNYLKQLAEGNLSERLQLDNQDEFAQITTEVNKLADQLAGLLQKVSVNTQKVVDASQQSKQVAEQVNVASEQQNQISHTIVEAMSETRDVISDIAKNVESTLQQAKLTHQESDKGSELVHQMVIKISNLHHLIDTASQAVCRVSNDVQGIAQASRSIEEIAEQTNLLALNAAIEASRAGESGRGFAVVADEVRNLAQRTQQSTAEIERMLKQLQSGTQDAVDKMKQGFNEVQNTDQAAIKAGESLDKIATAMGQVVVMASQIAAATEQQSSAVKHVSENVDNLANISEQSVVSALQSNSNSDSLSVMTMELEQTLSQFKLA